MNTTSNPPNEENAATTNLEPKEGSSLYYSLLFAQHEARARVLPTLQLIRTISTTLYEVSEPTIAEKKIHWWHEELARMAKRSARHPACVAVQDYLHRPDAVNACLRILSAAASERYSPLATNAELHEMIEADYGARIQLVEKALSVAAQTAEQHVINMRKLDAPSSKPDALQNCSAGALGLGQMHRLSTLAQRLQQGYSVFSDEQYAQFKITPEQLLNEPTMGAALLNDTVEQAGNLLDQAISDLNAEKSQTSDSLPMRTMLQLRLAQANLWRKKRPDLLHEYITVTPVRKFFIAYRCKRRFA